jgi:hypothetical protein
MLAALRRIVDPALISRGPGRDRAMAALAVAFGTVTWVQFFWRVIGPALSSAHFPTSAYWVGPRLVWEGRAWMLVDPGFGNAAVELGAFRDIGFLPNSPAAVLPLLPFGLLPESVAYPLWTALSVAALLAAVVLLVHSLRAWAVAVAFVLAVLPLFEPLRSNIEVGQGYAFVLLAAVVASVASVGAKSGIAAGLALAGVAILKLYYALVLLLPALVVPRPKVLAAWIAALVAAFAAGVMLVGIDGWATWLQSAVGWRSRPETSVTAYQTLNSLFGHLFRYDATWNPGPVVEAPFLVDVLWALSAVVLIGISAWAIRRHSALESTPDRLLPAIAVMVPIALLLSPVAEDHHYVLALLPLLTVTAVAVRCRKLDLLSAIALTGAVVLLAPPWPFNQERVEGWSALFFYPRVYGAALLWVAALRSIVHDESTAA